jgi:NAD kinase
LVFDSINEQATALASVLQERFGNRGEPNLVISIGGDGTMLHAIRKHWRRRLPFFGINTGHLGFLLNDVAKENPQSLFTQSLSVFQSPLLYVETLHPDGSVQQHMAVNDAYVLSPWASGWYEISVDGKVRRSHVVGDGLLVATAVGSSAYARAMGAQPILIGTPQLVLAGSNISSPLDWRPAHLPLDSEIVFRTLDPTNPKKRPMEAVVDGVRKGEVLEMRIRASRVGAVELAFTDASTPAEKLAALVFGSH